MSMLPTPDPDRVEDAYKIVADNFRSLPSRDEHGNFLHRILVPPDASEQTFEEILDVDEVLLGLACMIHQCNRGCTKGKLKTCRMRMGPDQVKIIEKTVFNEKTSTCVLSYWRI